jgi:sporulation-control protein spo0M
MKKDTKTAVRISVKVMLVIALGLFYLTIPSSPSDAQGFAVAFQRPEFIVSPGEQVTGSIPVTNTSEIQLALVMYTGDLVPLKEDTSDYTYAEGEYAEEGVAFNRSLKDWIIFSPERMTLEPGETREVTFEIDVPDDSELEGSYWAVIFIERIPEEEPEITAQGEGEIGIGIRTIFRYALNIFATIEGTETREATFTAFNMQGAENGFDAIATMQNNSNIYLRPKVWIELRDSTGEVVYTLEHEEQTVLPETARDFVFELRDLPIESGEYLVMVIADYGVQTFIAAQGRVDLTINPPPPEDAVDTSGSETEPAVEGTE